MVDFALNFTPGAVCGLLLGWNWVEVLLLGGVTYISSSGIIAKLLTDFGWLGNRETPAVLIVLVMEDLAMALYLPIIVVLLVGTGLASGLAPLAAALATVVIVLLLAVRYGDAMSRFIGGNDETILLTVFGLILLVAGLAQRLQVSTAVGAFLLGIAVSGQVAERTHNLLSPLRDLFAATFFLFFGLQTDAAALPGALPLALGLGFVTALTKIATGWIAAGRLGVATLGRLRAGMALTPRGRVFHRDRRAGRQCGRDCAACTADRGLRAGDGRRRLDPGAFGRTGVEDGAGQASASSRARRRREGYTSPRLGRGHFLGHRSSLSPCARMSA